MNILVTGAGGLIGSTAVNYFLDQGHRIYGIENDQRKVFFGEQASTNKMLSILLQKTNFINFNIDIRDRTSILKLFKEIKFDVVIHTAAQPSHDKAADIPFDDFEVNAVGTLNLLEATRQTNKDCIFIHMSTNKVYGDKPNTLQLLELETRFEYDGPLFGKGIPEDFSIDQSKHSLFGASKLAGDILVQEYGRYFNIPSCVLRGGCLTGENHSSVQLHGFLSYLIKCAAFDTKYTIFGYKGKQVRDNIHSLDVIQLMSMFIEKPRVAEVYNIGGGYENSCSVLEAIEKVERVSGKKMIIEYQDQNRIGDHVCYYSDLTKIKNHYPDFKIQRNLLTIIELIYESYKS